MSALRAVRVRLRFPGGIGVGGRIGVAVAVGLVLSAGSSTASAATKVAKPCTTPAAGGEWPSYGHDVANTRTQPEEQGLGPTAVPGLTPAWVFSTSSTGDGTGFNTTPVVNNGCVFIGSFAGF